MGPSEERRLFKAMRDFGLEIGRPNGRGHRPVTYNGEIIAGLPGESGGSDWRGWANALRDVRQGSGFDWRPKQTRKRQTAQA